MKDINSALLQAYFEAISAIPIPVYENEEPDDIKDKIYVVLSDVSSIERSTKNSSDLTATIQVSVHSWEYKYNNSKTVNNAVDQIFSVIRPDSNSFLDLSEFGLQMLNLGVQLDRTERIGRIGGKEFITRYIIFKQDIFII